MSKPKALLDEVAFRWEREMEPEPLGEFDGGIMRVRKTSPYAGWGKYQVGFVCSNGARFWLKGWSATDLDSAIAMARKGWQER